MIAYLEGEIAAIESGYAVILVNGVGYQALLSKKDLENLSEKQKLGLFIHTHVREDALELYGFKTRSHKQIFLLLISVSGVGPKLALTILSALEPHSLLQAVINKDLTTLSSVPGIGKKTAERLSLELKEKALKIDISHETTYETNDMRSQLQQAIRSLGYSKTQSDQALQSISQEDFNEPFEALIKRTLTFLSGAKS